MRFLGVAGIWDDGRRTTGSNANGTWIRYPDGSIEQWGTVTLSSGLATVTFPLAFPTACGYIGLTPIFAAASSSVAAAHLQTAPTKTGATVLGRTISGSIVAVGSFTVNWFASGT